MRFSFVAALSLNTHSLALYIRVNLTHILYTSKSLFSLFFCLFLHHSLSPSLLCAFSSSSPSVAKYSGRKQEKRSERFTALSFSSALFQLDQTATVIHCQSPLSTLCVYWTPVLFLSTPIHTATALRETSEWTRARSPLVSCVSMHSSTFYLFHWETHSLHVIEKSLVK